MFKTKMETTSLRFVISSFEFRDLFVNSNFVNSSFTRRFPSRSHRSSALPERPASVTLDGMAKKATPGKPVAKRKVDGAVSSAGRLSALLDTRIVYYGDNLEQLAKLPDQCVDLIHVSWSMRTGGVPHSLAK